MLIFTLLFASQSGPGGFEEVRRYVKQGGDFCKELAAILHERYEYTLNFLKSCINILFFLKKKMLHTHACVCFTPRAELEANYAKGLSKLSGKLTKACAKDQGKKQFLFTS